MSAVQNRYIPDNNIPAPFQCDGFIAATLRYLGAAYHTLAPYQARPHNRNIVQAFSVDKTVLPVTMAKVLVSVVLVSFRCIIPGCSGRSRANQYCALVYIQTDIVFEVNGVRKIQARRKINGTSSGSSSSGNGRFYSLCVYLSAVSLSAEIFYIEQVSRCSDFCAQYKCSR